MDLNSFLKGRDWMSVGDWFHVFNIGDQNAINNIGKLIDIIQKSQINFDISLQTISYQTQTKGTWQSSGISLKLLDDIDDSSTDWLNFSDDVTAQLNEDHSTCMTWGTVCCTAWACEKWCISLYITDFLKRIFQPVNTSVRTYLSGGTLWPWNRPLRRSQA